MEKVAKMSKESGDRVAPGVYRVEKRRVAVEHGGRSDGSDIK